MIFRVDKIDSPGLEKLNRMINKFYQNMFNENEFDGCLSDNLTTICNAGKKTTRGLLESVFNEYSKLDASRKAHFQKLYDCQRDLLKHFDDDSLAINRHENQYSDLWSACKKASSYLYSSTLGFKCFTDLGGTNIHEHFESYRSANGNVCCFCGLEEYAEFRELSIEYGNEEEKQWRGDYDHLLCKSEYPFLSVNFDNLIPACRSCNQNAKGPLDLLAFEGQRTIAFNPYVDLEGVIVSVAVEFDDDFEGIWSFQLNAHTENDKGKVETWDRVYEISPRLAARLKQNGNDYFKASLSGVTTLADARKSLTLGANHSDSKMKSKREAFLEAKCIKHISSLDDGVLASLIVASNQQYSDRHI